MATLKWKNSVVSDKAAKTFIKNILWISKIDYRVLEFPVRQIHTRIFCESQYLFLSMGSIYRPWYIFSNFFANLQAQVTVTYADMGRVMIGYSTTQFATQNNAKKKVTWTERNRNKIPCEKWSDKPSSRREEWQ